MNAAERVAAAFRDRGIVAHAGRSWDGHDQDPFGEMPAWYFSPRAGGDGVLASCEIHGDTIFVEPEEVQPALERIAAMVVADERHFVWEALTGKPFGEPFYVGGES